VRTAPIDGNDTRVNLMARLPGTAAKAAEAIVLLGHSDVVPADAIEWSVPPFEGAVHGDRLVGRGAADMLSMVALETLTLVALSTLPAAERPAHDVILLVTADEEVDGKGIQQALRDWPELKQAKGAINEGGFLLESYLRPGEDLAAIAVAEKGLFQFVLEARGPSGHGSTPVDDAAPDRVVRAASRMLAKTSSFRWTRATERQMHDIADARGGVEGIVLANPPLATLLAQGTLEATPSSRALFRDTCALTMLEGGLKRNVIPPTARATFDCRLLPGTDPVHFRDEVLATVDDPRIKLTVLNAATASGSDPDGAIVVALRDRLKQEMPAVVVAATLTKGATDCRFLRDAGVPCYGFIPIRITRDELEALHGKDESVRVTELERALARLVDVTHALAR
jgi:acetylornithine deacetylase/succinyl-diaminopimelate desuccinylase-like protein